MRFFGIRKQIKKKKTSNQPMLGLDLSNNKTAIENAYEHHITSYGSYGQIGSISNETKAVIEMSKNVRILNRLLQ